jgi:hypothetical protein
MGLKTEMHTPGLLVPELSAFEFEMDTEKLIPKSLGTDQTPTELIKPEGRTILSEIHKLTNFIFNKEELTEQREESTIVPVDEKGDKTTVIIIEGYQFIKYTPNSYPTSCRLG